MRVAIGSDHAGFRLKAVVAGHRVDDLGTLFLATRFEGGRHVARLAQVAAIEREECV